MLCRRPMGTLGFLITSAVMAIINIIGMHINGFIVAVNLMDMRKGRPLKPIDKILLILSVSQLCLQFLYIVDIVKCFESLSDAPLDTPLGFCFTFQKSLEFCGLWFTAWLCFLYSVKVVNCKLRWFLAIKVRISQTVLPVIVVSMVMSITSGSLIVLSYTEDCKNSISGNTSSNLNFELVFPPFIFGHFLPFTIITMSSVFLLHTLLSHIHRLKQSPASFPAINTDAYTSSIRSLVLFILLTVFKFASAIVLGVFPFYSLLHTVCALVSLVYPTVQAFAVCLGNSRLKQACHKMVAWIKKCMTSKRTIRCDIQVIAH